TYMRRPDYYAAFNAGPRKSNTQSFGLGLLWHPKGGIMLSSQTEDSSSSSNRGLSWGTKKSTAGRVYENGNVLPTYKINGQPIQPTVGHGDIAQGNMEVQYNLGNNGTKTVTFLENGISVQVNHQDEFVEYLPLMIGPEDSVTVDSGTVKVVRGNAVLEIVFDSGAEANLVRKSYRIYDYRMHMLTLQTSGSLSYTMTLSAIQPDMAAPMTRASIEPGEPDGDSGWYTTDVMVTLDASDNLSGVVRTEYRLNGGEWKTYGGAIAVASEGTNTLEYRSIDRAGNMEETHSVALLIDKTAPTINIVPDRPELWPPNGTMVPIKMTVNAADGISGIRSVTLDSIVCNELDPECMAEAEYGKYDTEFLLKAERSGGGPGRVYTITYTASDKAGHVTTGTSTVTVPHDRGK
ncbi:hypothetical protein ABES02_29445, partial [Neobacillus pocheonensis]|uniref:OmpL47-type beta-barrel domain-containing protein n=1 Tax=Neobacillus pocheonensis TaxID=363869 RepID=UPI003D27D5BA